MKTTDTSIITFLFLTYNEEKNLPGGLDSIPHGIGKILVVDSFSTDQTLAILEERHIEYVQNSFENYSKQRNYAQSLIKTPWVFHLDADERLTPELAKWIQSEFPQLSQQVDGFYFSRQTVFMNRWIRYGGHYPNYHLRLFKINAATCEEKMYDQHFVAKPGSKLYTIKRADIVNIVSESLFQFTSQHNKWSELEASEIVSNQKVTGPNLVQARLFGSPVERRRWLKNHLFMKNPLFIRPLLYFVYRYIFRLGFLDGIPGLIFHFLQGFWFRFLVDAKVYEQKQKI